MKASKGSFSASQQLKPQIPFDPCIRVFYSKLLQRVQNRRDFRAWDNTLSLSPASNPCQPINRAAATRHETRRRGPRVNLPRILNIFLVHPLPCSNVMSTEVLCPKPQRPHKRALPDIDSDLLPVSNHTRRSSPPLPTPSIHGQRSESPPPPRPPSSQSLEDLDPRSAPRKKRRRLQSPRFEPTDDQHLQITRSGSAPRWPICTPGSKHCRPQLPTDSSVNA